MTQLQKEPGGSLLISIPIPILVELPEKNQQIISLPFAPPLLIYSLWINILINSTAVRNCNYTVTNFA